MKTLILSVTIVAVALGLLLLSRKNSHHQLNVTAYFQNAMDIKRGSSVWVDGVQVGAVSSVSISSKLKERPVEINMAMSTPYELIIPNDSVAMFATQGVLGPTVINIDTRGANGAPTSNGATLKSKEPPPLSNKNAADVMEKIGNALSEQAKQLRQQGGSTASPVK